MKTSSLLCSAGLVLMAQACFANTTPVATSQQATSNHSIIGKQYVKRDQNRQARNARRDNRQQRVRRDRDRNTVGQVIRGVVRAGIISDRRDRRDRYRNGRRYDRGYHHSRSIRRGAVRNPNGYRSFRQHGRNDCTYQPYGNGPRQQTPCYGRP